MKEVSGKWSGPEAGEHYAVSRFRSTRAEARDPRLVARLLARHGVRADRGGLLDVPCGTGRLYEVLAAAGEPVTSVDVAPSMLQRPGPAARRVLASADRLPFADGSFDVVVCCRLLHHLRAAADLERVVAELVRVSSRLVIASFWDAGSLPAWRVRVGLKRDEGPRGRTAFPRSRMARRFTESGAVVLEFAHCFRFLSQQTFLCARKQGGPD